MAKKFTKKEIEKGFKLSVIIPDIHHPYHHKPTIGAIFDFIKKENPDEVILSGDALDMASINHWEKKHGNLKYFEGRRLQKDYVAFSNDILVPIEKIVPKANLVFMAGNHEYWAVKLIKKNPQLEGMIEPEISLELEARGWKWIPYLKQNRYSDIIKGSYKIGKLTVVHDTYTNKYHSAKTLDTYTGSVLYCHTHDVQVYTKVSINEKKETHMAQSIGCTCMKSPGYGKGRPNRWVHAFAIVYSYANGNFNVYTPIIFNGKFVLGGKMYSNK